MSAAVIRQLCIPTMLSHRLLLLLVGTSTMPTCQYVPVQVKLSLQLQRSGLQRGKLVPAVLQLLHHRLQAVQQQRQQTKSNPSASLMAMARRSSHAVASAAKARLASSSRLDIAVSLAVASRCATACIAWFDLEISCSLLCSTWSSDLGFDALVSLDL